MVKKTLEQRLDEMLRLRAAGRNCAQTVAAVFDDLESLPDTETMMCLLAPMGGGIGGQGMICGALSAALMVDAAANPRHVKAEAYARARELTAEFAAPHGGHFLCRDLKAAPGASCNWLIAESITILHNSLS